MQKPHDDSKASLTAFVQDSTLTAVIEMSLASWLVAGMSLVSIANRGRNGLDSVGSTEYKDVAPR